MINYIVNNVRDQDKCLKAAVYVKSQKSHELLSHPYYGALTVQHITTIRNGNISS